MTSASPTETDLKRIERMNAADLEQLYRAVKKRIPAERLMEMTNGNVLSVRMPKRVLEQIRSLALASGKTRSQILREALDSYTNSHESEQGDLPK